MLADTIKKIYMSAIRELRNRHVFRVMLLKTDLCSEKKFPYEKRVTKSEAVIPSPERTTGSRARSSRHMAVSAANPPSPIPQASLISDKTALKALIALSHSCEGDRMIDVPRRGIACLDSQIEKINRTRPTLHVTMGRLQTELIRADPSPSPARLCSFPRPPGRPGCSRWLRAWTLWQT